MGLPAYSVGINIHVWPSEFIFSCLQSTTQQYEDLKFNLLKSVITLCIDLNFKKMMFSPLARETLVLLHKCFWLMLFINFTHVENVLCKYGLTLCQEPSEYGISPVFKCFPFFFSYLYKIHCIVSYSVL